MFELLVTIVSVPAGLFILVTAERAARWRRRKARVWRRVSRFIATHQGHATRFLSDSARQEIFNEAPF